MTNYRRGTVPEYAIMKFYEKHEFYTIRSAGSHGMFDVVAIRETNQPSDDRTAVVLIQAKRNLSPKALDKLMKELDGCKVFGTPEIWNFTQKKKRGKVSVMVYTKNFIAGCWAGFCPFGFVFTEKKLRSPRPQQKKEPSKPSPASSTSNSLLPNL